MLLLKMTTSLFSMALYIPPAAAASSSSSSFSHYIMLAPTTLHLINLYFSKTLAPTVASRLKNNNNHMDLVPFRMQGFQPKSFPCSLFLLPSSTTSLDVGIGTFDRMFGSRAASRCWQFSGICGDGGGGGGGGVSTHGPSEETDLPILGDCVQANDPAVCVQSDDDDDEEEEYQVESRSSAKVKGELQGGLYLVATPIGNLEDITIRALRILKEAEVILAEDTRHSAKLLRYYNIDTPMMSYHKFNEYARQDAIMQRLKAGQIIALISDAGMPGISDPGSELVRVCVDTGVQVHPIPGASAVITALVSSGLPTDEFSFAGFLPTHMGTRQQRLVAAAKQTATQVFYVPPHKLCRVLDDCITAFGATRHCVVAREMTKLHEEFCRGTLEQIRKQFEDQSPRGEITLVIEGIPQSASKQILSEEEIEAQLGSLIAAGISPSEASRRVVEDTGMRRKVVYPLALKLAKVQS
ncbi:unnamed protein product [Sphagnum compactum]